MDITKQQIKGIVEAVIKQQNLKSKSKLVDELSDAVFDMLEAIEHRLAVERLSHLCDCDTFAKFGEHSPKSEVRG